MSNSPQKRAARTRMSYTGESYQAALSGIPRKSVHGLDSATIGQRYLRVLMALGIFNRGQIAAHPFGSWGASEIISYTVKMSPRWNQTVLIADAPHNVAKRILPTKSNPIHFPGLRLERLTGYGSYVLKH